MFEKSYKNRKYWKNGLISIYIDPESTLKILYLFLEINMPALSYIIKHNSIKIAIDFVTIAYLFTFACNKYAINCHTLVKSLRSLQFLIVELKESSLNQNSSELHRIQKVLLKCVFKEFAIKFIKSDFIVPRFVQTVNRNNI